MANDIKKTPAQQWIVRGVQVSVWTNSDNKGVWYSTTVVKRYKDNNGEYQSSNNFGREELIIVCTLTQWAAQWIEAQRTQRHADGDRE